MVYKRTSCITLPLRISHCVTGLCYLSSHAMIARVVWLSNFQNSPERFMFLKPFRKRADWKKMKRRPKNPICLRKATPYIIAWIDCFCRFEGYHVVSDARRADERPDVHLQQREHSLHHGRVSTSAQERYSARTDGRRQVRTGAHTTVTGVSDPDCLSVKPPTSTLTQGKLGSESSQQTMTL